VDRSPHAGTAEKAPLTQMRITRCEWPSGIRLKQPYVLGYGFKKKAYHRQA
jgi:hypothetical protein